mgnify:CR=1 FL=1
MGRELNSIGWTISKKAVKNYINGDWILAKGGLKNKATGKIEELVKPVVKELAFSPKGEIISNLSSPVTLVSSVVNNVQSAHIEYGVHQANKKLDVSLEKLDKIQESVKELSKLNTFGWTNCILEIANCGISIVGFRETFERLNELSGQLQNITKIIEKKLEDDYKKEYSICFMNMVNYIPWLEKETTSEQEICAMIPSISQYISFLNSIIDRFEEGSINEELAYEIICVLSVVGSKFMKTYSALHYYYIKTKFPSYDLWINVIHRIVEPEFLEKVRNYLVIQRMDLCLEEKHAIYNTIAYIPKYQLGELNHNEIGMQNLSVEDYFNNDAYIARYIKSKNYETIGQDIYIPISTQK